MEQVADDWRQADLLTVDSALCAFAEQLSANPGAMERAHVESLRAEDLDDVAIHDAIQTIAYFHYINRVADAVHVALDSGMPDYPDGGR